MSRRIKGGLLVAILAALTQAPAFALSNTTMTSPFTRGVEAAPAAIERADGLYTAGGAAMMLATPNFRARVAAPEAMAREFLAARYAQLGLSASEQATLERSSQRIGRHFSVVRFSQRIGGVPVYGSDVAVSVMPNGRVIYVSNATVPGAAAVNTVAHTSSADALAIGTQYLGIATARHQKAERMIYVANGVSHLVWRLELVAEDGPRGDWELLVDASTGTVLRAEDKAAYDDGTATIWTPDPLSENLATYSDPGYVDGNNADTPQLTDALVPVTLEGITQHGRHVHARRHLCRLPGFRHAARRRLSVAGVDRFLGHAQRHDVRRRRWATTTSRAISSTSTRRSASPAMPINHPGGVHFDPHGFDGADNSQFSSAGENLTFGQGGVDDAQDADVIIHELGHGIHDFITNGNLSQTEGFPKASATTTPAATAATSRASGRRPTRRTSGPSAGTATTRSGRAASPTTSSITPTRRRATRKSTRPASTGPRATCSCAT